MQHFKDIQTLFKEMVGEVLQRSLEGELDDELGYTKYDYLNTATQAKP